ncbi:MAG TPA: D-glycero-beta-D-manno-heptose 1-phosphate adenylyltransferase [Flavisolibacter sp.]|nr:D-glycero-beta-D-manno-heptose 1-phosphate adenylyltransferase [Flavisolibacter sp.]
MNRSELQKKIQEWRSSGKKIVFTNGCFDILHVGHIHSLLEAATTGDILIVAINSDASVKQLKGNDRPVNDEQARAFLLASLSMVDAVTIFSELTPFELIISIRPDVLVKGGDYKLDEIAGAKEVIESGGQVIINPIVQGYSTTDIIKKLQNL